MKPAHRVRTGLTALAVITVTGVTGCDQPMNDVAFLDLFPEQRRIELDEDPSDPIVGITALSIAPDGRLVVTDQAASKIRIFDANGARLSTLGVPGEGPGELQTPTWASVGDRGEIRVVEQGSPRLTTYGPDDSARVFTVPGHYGFWIEPAGDVWAVGVATRETRFAIGSLGSDAWTPFGSPAESVNTTPFWIFFSRDRAVVLGDGVWTNSSFIPEIRSYDLSGELIATHGLAPEGWLDPTPPPIDRVEAPGDREVIESWARSFTVVTGMAAHGDSLVVLQFGRHDPNPQDRYATVPSWIELYGADGVRVTGSVPLDRPILAGGAHLYLLAAEPPAPWTITVH